MAASEDAKPHLRFPANIGHREREKAGLAQRYYRPEDLQLYCKDCRIAALTMFGREVDAVTAIETSAMENPDLGFSVMTISRAQDAKELQVPDGFERVVGAEFAHGYRRGQKDLLALAAVKEGEKFVAGTAGGVGLEHPEKRSILFIVVASAERPFQGRGLERTLLDLLVVQARTEGYGGVCFSEEAAAFRADPPYLPYGES